VWEYEGPAADAGDEAARWFSDFLGLPGCRLCRHVDAAGPRPCEAEFAPGAVTAFSDGFPFLLANEASLDDLNARLAAGGDPPVTMERFRANVVVAPAGGAGAVAGAGYAEDGWARVVVGAGAEFELVKPCSRCTVPQVDPETGETGPQPSAALRQTRKGSQLPLGSGRRGWGNKLFFGWNCVTGDEGAVLAVGDPVRVVPRA